MFNIESVFLQVYKDYSDVFSESFFNTFRVDHMFCDNIVASNFIQVINTEFLFDPRMLDLKKAMRFVGEKYVVPGEYKGLLDATNQTLEDYYAFQKNYNGEKIVIIHPLVIGNFPKYKEMIEHAALSNLLLMMNSDPSNLWVLEVEETNLIPKSLVGGGGL